MSIGELNGKIALITGGTTGIGLATAQAFHGSGARVIITGNNPDTLRAAQEVLPAGVAVWKSDARSVAAASQLSDEVRKVYGHLDVLFLNAGVVRFESLEEAQEATFDDLMGVNVKGVVFTLQKLLPLLRPGASVLVNTSMVARQGVPNCAIYSATKGALAALVRALAVELASRGIRVNAISPGPIVTPALVKSGVPEEALPAFQEQVSASVPMRRFGRAEEVAQAALFLASPASSYMTGSEVAVDGGATAS